MQMARVHMQGTSWTTKKSRKQNVACTYPMPCTFQCPTDSAGIHQNLQEQHWNGTGIDILENYYCMQVYISVVCYYLIISNTITPLYTYVCYYLVTCNTITQLYTSVCYYLVIFLIFFKSKPCIVLFTNLEYLQNQVEV